jgi:hypothetical protein
MIVNIWRLIKQMKIILIITKDVMSITSDETNTDTQDTKKSFIMILNTKTPFISSLNKANIYNYCFKRNTVQIIVTTFESILQFWHRISPNDNRMRILGFNRPIRICQPINCWWKPDKENWPATRGHRDVNSKLTSWSHREVIVRPSWGHHEVIMRSTWSHREVNVRSSWCQLKVNVVKSSWGQLEVIMRSTWGHH